MKRKRNLIIMAVVFVVLCGVIVFEQTWTRHIDSISTTDEIILTISQDELTAVTWTYSDATLAFESTDGTWYDSEDGDFPVDQEVMAEFLSYYEEVHACFIIDDVEDYSQYGLEEPQCTVTISTEDEEIVISMGSYSTMDELRYISIGDGKVYLINDDLLEYITTDRDDFMLNDEVPTILTLIEMTISGEVELDVIYDAEGIYAYTDSYNYYQVENGSYLMLDDSSVETYLSRLTNVSLSDYVTYTASSEDLSVYGLDNPAYTITVKGTIEVESEESEEDADETEEDEEAETEEIEYVLYVGTVTTEVEEGSDDEAETTIYVRLGDSEIIYEITSTSYLLVSTVSYDSLRPSEVVSLDWDTMTNVTMTFESETYEISTMTQGEYIELYGVEEEEAEEDEDAEEIDEEAIVYVFSEQIIDLDAVMTAIDALEINTFSDEESTKTLELSLTVTLDREAYTTVSVDIYRYDGDNCVVMVDGTCVGLMARSLMIDLREAMTSIVLGME